MFIVKENAALQLLLSGVHLGTKILRMTLGVEHRNFARMASRTIAPALPVRDLVLARSEIHV
jgi:hypothetical protein